MSHEDFRGKRVLVMGLGRFGGGIGVTKWLCECGARVVVTDAATEAELSDSVAALDGLDVELHLGGHDLSDLDGVDLLVASPAVDKRRSEFFQEAMRRGIPWSSEMNLFLERCRARIAGITGSVGKSTTTAMVGEILAAAERQSGWKYGRVWLGGNIGKSLLHDLPEMTADDIVVLELSSFQLEDAARIARSPRYALITNIRENHLDRHGTMASYAAAKSNIYRFQTRGDILGIPQEGADDWPVDDWRDRRPLVRFGIEPRKREIVLDVHESQSGGSRQLRFPQVEITVPGLHNLQNAAAAMALSQMLDLGHSISLAALRDFSGLIHRLEFVREVAGVRYYNDSKATTPDAAMTALRAFDRPVVMIVGGSDKGSSFSELAAAAVGQAKAVVCVGATRDRLVSEITRARGDSTSPSVHPAGDFEAALTLARSAAQGGDVVLLSPGCASYDMFVNYEQRGDTFKRVVRSWA